MAKPMPVRQSIQSALDMCQFYFDVLPRLRYQPLPWLGLRKARRGKGTEQRWSAIEEALFKYSSTSTVGLGCDVGFFSFSIAKQGIAVLAVEFLAHAIGAHPPSTPDGSDCTIGWRTAVETLEHD